MATTIQISSTLLKELKQRKMFNKESYEDLIWDLLEDNMELSKESKSQIEKSRRDIKRGRYYTHEQVKEELGL